MLVIAGRERAKEDVYVFKDSGSKKYEPATARHV